MHKIFYLLSTYVINRKFYRNLASTNADNETLCTVHLTSQVVVVQRLQPTFTVDYYVYEGCSKMNASSFITFVTYMLRQNGIRFYKGLYVTFKLAPDL